jgi:1-acyl-sn-glycerol-3-phosphate acyltransferase
MLQPQPSKLARMIFNPYEEYLLKKNFSHFYLFGNIPSPDKEKSLLVTPNHFSWWDGFFIDYAVRKLFNRNFYILMLEEQLRKYKFFRKLGAFSIEPKSKKGMLESLLYAGNLLRNPDKSAGFLSAGQHRTL